MTGSNSFKLDASRTAPVSFRTVPTAEDFAVDAEGGDTFGELFAFPVEDTLAGVGLDP